MVLGDLLKGAMPVLLARFVTGGDPLVEVLCGVAAVAGAIWSVFVGFRSGRGVGTGVGTMLVIQPVAVLLAAPVFIGAIVLTRYVSLGSLLGSAAMVPAMLLVLLVVPETPLPYVLYSAVGAALIWLAHADNIDRLLHGTERKFDLGALAGRPSSSDRLIHREKEGPGSADGPGRRSRWFGGPLSRPAPRGLDQPPRMLRKQSLQ